MRPVLILACLGLALAAATPLPAASTPPPTSAASDSQTESRYRQLLEMDDDALAEVDRWIREEQAQRTQGTALTHVTLKAQIQERLRPVRLAYENFLREHPEHARARLAFGSFLSEIGDEDAAVTEMEKARESDPSNPAAWNNLANYYGHRGPVAKALEYYAKALALNPQEPVYYQNLATTVFVFRKDAREFYGIDEPAVFEKALELYRQAIKLDPTNFVLATEYAQSFYGMLPLVEADPQARAQKNRAIAERAIPAWREALRLAEDDVQREGTLIHLARNQLLAGRLAEARTGLASVTNEVYLDLKTRLLRNISDQETGTNAPAPAVPAQAP